MPGNFHTITFEEISTWPTPNYTTPEARLWLPGYGIGWTVLVTAFVFGRLYLRIRNRSGAFGLDDVFIIIAWVFSVAFTGAGCVSVWYYDIGRHIWDMRPDSIESALYWGWLSQVLFVHSTCACKVSVLLFYRRMAKNAYSKKWLYAVWILLFITIGAWISIFVSYCLMCTPLNAYWSVYKMMAAGNYNYTCINGGGITIAAGVLTIASDFWTAGLPCLMFQIYDLGVSRRQKIALNTIFCLGFLVTGVGVARTYYLWEMGWAMDISWIGYDLFATCLAECNLGIILCCAPFLRALFRKYFPDLTHNSTHQSRRTDPADKERWSSNGVTFQPVALEQRNEKKGYLVLEETSGRLVWEDEPRPYDPLRPEKYDRSGSKSTPYNTITSIDEPISPVSPVHKPSSPPMSPVRPPRPDELLQMPGRTYSNETQRAYSGPYSPHRTWQNQYHPPPSR